MRDLISPLFSGMMTGMFLQLALGPVFFYILGITVESHFINTLAAVSAVTLADYIYIILSLIGLGRLIQEDTIKKRFSIFSSMILMIFGAMILAKGVSFAGSGSGLSAMDWTPVSSFTSSFILTISSPLTIIFWSSVFSAKAVEKNYKNRELIIFGIGTGASTFLFLASSMALLAYIKSDIPLGLVRVSNVIVGLVLLYYGITRIIKTRKILGQQDPCQDDGGGQVLGTGKSFSQDK